MESECEMQTKVPVGVYQIKVTLKRTKPSIWRRIAVPCDITLGRLHDVIQLAMGWMDCHLHEFVIDGKRYGSVTSAESDYGNDMINERRTLLNAVAGPNAKFLYNYDFGDDWIHELHIEREVASGGERAARCQAGKNACPPEDCGGPSGYARLLAILSNPEHEDHEEMLEWADDDVDPNAFDVKEVDRLVSVVKV